MNWQLGEKIKLNAEAISKSIGTIDKTGEIVAIKRRRRNSILLLIAWTDGQIFEINQGWVERVKP